MSLLSRRQVDAFGHPDAQLLLFFSRDSSYSLRKRRLILVCTNCASLYVSLLLNSDLVSQIGDTSKLRAKFPAVPVSGVLFLRRFSNSSSSLSHRPSAEVVSVLFAYEFPLGIARSYGRPDCSSVSSHAWIQVIMWKPRKGIDRIMEALCTVGIQLFVLAALKEYHLWVSFVILLFVYAV